MPSARRSTSRASASAAARTVVKPHCWWMRTMMCIPREPDVRGKPIEPVLAQHLVGQQRDTAHAVPRRVGHRVDVDAQLVGMIEVRAPDRVRVPVDVAERDRPQQVRGVDRHELLRLAAGRELQHRRLEPLGALLRHALLIDRLRLDPAGKRLSIVGRSRTWLRIASAHSTW